MKKVLLILAISITAAMATSNIYDYLSTSSSMNIFISNPSILDNINLLENALDSDESDKIKPIKIEAPSFWMV